jgi:hypothetical protein
MFFKTFGGSFAVTAVFLFLAFLYGGTPGLTIATILAILEISVSFDNAVVNATVLGKMSLFWQKIFLTVGIAIAVFGMRLAFPLIIVGITAHLSPAEAVNLALEKGSQDTPGTYANLLHEAHPAIAAFGGVFLLMLFLNFIFEEREITWLSWLEKPLARIGRLDQLAVVVSVVLLLIAATELAPHDKGLSVLISGSLGMITYILVSGLGDVLESSHEHADEEGASSDAGKAGKALKPNAQVALQVGKAAFVSFLYLEVLDASFSFDGVIGAFAITSDPIIIALGLGIGAMYIRSMTVFLVRKGSLAQYVYLEHGAQWAIGALSILLLLTIKFEVPELVTGLIGISLIAAAFVSSIVRNKRNPDAEESADDIEAIPATV